jgi:hypothetical protein
MALYLPVYCPMPNSPTAALVARGSGIVGEPLDAEFTRISFEGNLYGASNLTKYEDRVDHAAGRLLHRYPTIAIRVARSAELVCIGTWDHASKRLTITDQATLNTWLAPRVDKP